MKKETADYSDFENSSLAQSEEKIIDFWQENKIFDKALEKPSPQGEFVFYEGPPTANGRPGIHHLESRAFKDAIPRYKTMQGYHVRRRAGWDTHGLPVELEVEKQLGFSGKPDIEKYGIAKFNEQCRQSVLKYVDEWKVFTDRIGYWLTHEDAYYTYSPDFMESVWWTFAQAHEKGLLYKDYKVLPWCARCGTALSSHELAQGYSDVKDLSLTAKFELAEEPGTFFLAWTTTPWTLPGNLALAVGAEIDYATVQFEDNKYILALDLVEKVFTGKEHEVLGQTKGQALVGKKYQPLFSYFDNLMPAAEKEKLAAKAYQVYAADFVTTEDGTGIVHTAVMYGQDDFELGTEIDLPKFHLVDESGHFIAGLDDFSGRFVRDEDVAVDVIKNLAHRGLLFSKEKYEHTYPHCWRCKTPLIYYARDSWYIRMSDLREKLLENNDKINWEPDYIKEGRMGEWLKSVKDWAVSRERYWGTPLPIWISEESENMIVIDSLESLRQHLPTTKFIFVRHGEAQHNVSGIADSGIDSTADLTAKGVEQIETLASSLADEKIDLVISSPLLRTRRSAEIFSNKLDLKAETNELVKEIDFGSYNQKELQLWLDAASNSDNHLLYKAEGGESFWEVKNRVTKFMQDLASQYQGKTIAVFTHGAVLEMAQSAAEGLTVEKAIEAREAVDISYATPLMVEYQDLPKNTEGILDLHRPYIDEVILHKDGKTYRRVKEVMDVWFDSGAMPFAQDHYPFENQDWIEGSGYPADYISEAIDQTRGWFYVLQAIAAYLGKDSAPYKNVICLGHILDADGQKMSKSRGNTINPWEMISKYGADALRLWMYSINQPGEPKNFDEATVDEIVKKILNLLRNSHTFYQINAKIEHELDPYQSPDVMDKWILSLQDKLISEVTDYFDNYKLLEATRAIREFIGDFSQWYIRRSRDRFKFGDTTDKAFALATTRLVLMRTAKFLAPLAPFIAEELWLELRQESDEASVHLSAWPKTTSFDEEILADMEIVRELSSLGLKMRDKAGIKVRQPLQSFTITNNDLAGKDGLLLVLADEINVKSVIIDAQRSTELDTEITPQLQQEGFVRELTRALQDLRKQASLTVDDVITLEVINSDFAQSIINDNQWSKDLSKTINAKEIVFVDALSSEKQVELDFAGNQIKAGIIY